MLPNRAQSDSLASSQHEAEPFAGGQGKQLFQHCNLRLLDTPDTPGDSGRLGLSWRRGRGGEQSLPPGTGLGQPLRLGMGMMPTGQPSWQCK